MNALANLAALAAAVLVLGSCLTGETRHDLYLAPDGSVVWSVTEREVRSTEEHAEARASEEREFLDTVRAHDHGVARALRRLGARRVSSSVVRDVAPYTVVTEGSFDGVDLALGSLFEGLGVPHEIDLSWSADGTVQLDLTVHASESDSAEGDEALHPLAGSLSSYRFVLTAGVFVEAEGFELEAADTAARMIELDPAHGIARYRLVWKGAGA